MKVYDRNLTGAGAAETGRTQETHASDRAAGASLAGTKGEGDRVELSTTLGRVSRALASYGSDRAARVQALSAQYQSGQYRVDSMATGRAMIQDALAPAK